MGIGAPAGVLGTTPRGDSGLAGAGCPAGAGIVANVFGNTGSGWLGAAGVAGPADGVALRTPVAGMAGIVGSASVLDAGGFVPRGAAGEGETRGAVPGVTNRPAGAEPVRGVLAPPNSRFWPLGEFILDARSFMYASGFIGSRIPPEKVLGCTLLFALRVLAD